MIAKYRNVGLGATDRERSRACVLTRQNKELLLYKAETRLQFDTFRNF